MRKYIDIINENESKHIDLDDFIDGYIECLLWTILDDGGVSLNNKTKDDIAPHAMETIIADCKSFIKKTASYINEGNYASDLNGHSVEAMAGHDFWLTRNGHGAGFWDGDWRDHDVLCDVSEQFDIIAAFVNDNGEIDFG